jgi:hypothetical protein
VNLKNLTLLRLFYYQALRIVERAVLPTALVLNEHTIDFRLMSLFSEGFRVEGGSDDVDWSNALLFLSDFSLSLGIGLFF